MVQLRRFDQGLLCLGRHVVVEGVDVLRTSEGAPATQVSGELGEVAVQAAARAEVPGRYYILDVARALRVSLEEADKYIRLRPGQKVEARQAVAGRRTTLGLVPHVVRAPKEGIVAAVGTEHLIRLIAGFYHLFQHTHRTRVVVNN